MGLTKFLLALYIIGLTLTHVSLAGNDQKDFVNGHNAVRAKVGVPPLKWNNTLAAYARKYANTRIAKCELEHSNGPYGECIAEGFEELKAADAVKLWASEKPHYDHKSNKCVHGECGHYTQLVWRDTKRIGCARVKCHNGWMFVTCNYDPPGNYEGERPY
jgi:pathogenesis-related protein 1